MRDNCAFLIKIAIMCFMFFYSYIVVADTLSQKSDHSIIQQSSNSTVQKSSNIPSKSDKKSVWKKIWGDPTPNRLLLGLFSLHLMSLYKPSTDPNKQPPNWNNQLIGISYHGFFGATLVNSCNTRAYAAGIERYWFTTVVTPHFDYSLGYRLGLVTGYTQKTYYLAKYTPVLPFPELIFDLSYRKVQVEFMWCFQVLGVGFAYRF